MSVRHGTTDRCWSVLEVSQFSIPLKRTSSNKNKRRQTRRLRRHPICHLQIVLQICITRAKCNLWLSNLWKKSSTIQNTDPLLGLHSLVPSQLTFPLLRLRRINSTPVPQKIALRQKLLPRNDVACLGMRIQQLCSSRLKSQWSKNRD